MMDFYLIMYPPPFFLSSGFPFLTVANTMSPDPAAGSLFRRPLIPFTAMMYRFFAPVLSAQLITAPTGKPREMRNFPPEEPPRPGKGNWEKSENIKQLPRMFHHRNEHHLQHMYVKSIQINS